MTQRVFVRRKIGTGVQMLPAEVISQAGAKLTVKMSNARGTVVVDKEDTKPMTLAGGRGGRRTVADRGLHSLASRLY